MEIVHDKMQACVKYQYQVEIDGEYRKYTTFFKAYDWSNYIRPEDLHLWETLMETRSHISMHRSAVSGKWTVIELLNYQPGRTD